MLNLIETLNLLAITYSLPVIVSTHPRTRKKIDSMELGGLDERIQFLKPFGFCDYIKLQMESFCILSDSGTITEEASLLNLPAVTIRDAHERPEGMDVGVLIMSELKADRVLDAVKVVVSQGGGRNRRKKIVPDYDETFVSKKILQIVISYVDYINRTIWSKKTIE